MADNKVQPDPIVRLYNNIKNEYDLPDFNTFKADMSDSNKAKRLHATLVNDGYEVPQYDVFSVDMGLKKKAGNSASLGMLSPSPKEPNFLQQGQKVASGGIFKDISASVPKSVAQPVVKTTLKDAALKDKNNNNSYLAALYNGVVSSMETIAGGPYRLAAKFDSSPVSMIQEAVDKAASSVTGVNYEALREKEATDKIKNFVGKARSSASSREYEKGLAEGFDITNGIGLDDISGFVAVLPKMLTDIGFGVATGGTSFAIQGYDDALSTIDNIPEAKNMSETTRTAFGFGGAIISGVLEKLGMDNILKSGTATKYVTAKILKETAGELAKKGVKVTAEQFEKAVANKATQMLTKTALKNTVKAGVKAGKGEAITEATQEGAMDLMKLAANQIENKEIFNEEELKNTAASRYLNAAAMGGIFGGGVSIFSSRVKNVQKHIENEVKNAKSQEDIDNLVNEINQGVEDGVISQNDAELFKSMVDENVSKPSSLDINNEKEVKLADIDEYINSLDKRDRLYNDKLNELNKEKNEINSYYDNLLKKSQEDEEIPFDDGKSVSEENKTLDDELRTALDYRFYEKGLDSGDEWEREDSRRFLADPKKYFESKIEFAKESLSNNPNDESAKMLLEDNTEKLRVFNDITNKYKQNVVPDQVAGVEPVIKEEAIPSEVKVTEEVKPTEFKVTEDVKPDVYNYQDSNAEKIISDKNSWNGGVWRYKLENAGDILRELSKYKNTYLDPNYIYEKVDMIRDWIDKHKERPIAYEDSFDALKERDFDTLNKLKESYEKQPVLTEAQQKAKELILNIIDGDLNKAEKQIEYFESFKGPDAFNKLKEVNLYPEQKEKIKLTEEVQPTEAKVASDLVSVSVAPYYDTQIVDLSDASKLRESEGYKKHIQMLKDVAKKMGLEIDSIDNTIGGFENKDGNRITEISNRVKLRTNDLDVAERYAAVAGALAHEVQEATIAARYVKHGDKNQSAIEAEIKVSDLKSTVKALKEAGINDFEINENDNSVKILDFDNGKNEDFNNKMLSFADLLDKNNVKYETEHHAIESRYVDPERRSELLKEAKLQAERQEGGAELRDIYEKSKAKSEEFLGKKEVPTEIPEEVYTPIVNRIKKGIEKLSTTAKVSVLKGKNFSKALDEAIKNGKVNLQSWGGFEKKGFEESPQWQKLIEDGTVKLNFDIKGLEGKPVVVINPDNMLTGAVLTKNGKPIIDGNGGINFVTKFGDVWASSDNATANTLAKYINEARAKDIAAGGDGTVHVVVTKGDLSKSLTSHTGAKAAMKVLEYLVDKKYISLADFRKALTDVGRKYNIDLDGRLDAKSIHDDIAKKFFGVNDSTFSKRGFFVQDIIDHLAKNSKSAKDNISKIRTMLNTEALPQSTERKTGEISFAKEGIIDAIGHLLSDNMTVGVKNSEAYATIEIKHPVEVVNLNKEEGGHESYPFHLRQIDENGNKVKPVLNVLGKAQHVTDILNDANNQKVDKKGGAGKFGSNQIGMAKGFVKPAAEQPSGVNMMTDATGRIYGFEQNGKIVLNADLMNGNTPFHEAGHLWLNWAKENRSDLHDAGIRKIENSKYLQDVKNNKVYQENAAKLPKGEREAYFKEEALAKAIGDNGERFVNEAQKSDFRKWIKNSWETIATHFGLRGMTADEVSNLTLDEFSKKVVADIINEQKGGKEVQKEKTTQEVYKDLTRIEKRQIINSKFDELIKELKIEKICPT